MKYLPRLWLVGLLVFSFSSAQAESEKLDLSRYAFYTDFTVSGIVTPKVVRFQTSGDRLFRNTVLLERKEGKSEFTLDDLIPHRIIHDYSQERESIPFFVSLISSVFEGTKEAISDQDFSTYVTFKSEDLQHSVVIDFPQVTEISGVNVLFPEGIVSPKTVTIEGVFENGETNVIHKDLPFSPWITWASVKVKSLKFVYKTPHLFRIADMSFSGVSVARMQEEIVFFAEEGKTYRLYQGAYFGIRTYQAAYRPLETDSTTPTFALPDFSVNPDFNSDFDRDGISDSLDLCPQISDSANADMDKNGRGDSCEDPDQDGVYSQKDNCPYALNYDQKDSDLDGRGDACDTEENRMTELNNWLLPLMFGFAALVLIWLTVRSMKK